MSGLAFFLCLWPSRCLNAHCHHHLRSHTGHYGEFTVQEDRAQRVCVTTLWKQGQMPGRVELLWPFKTLPSLTTPHPSTHMGHSQPPIPKEFLAQDTRTTLRASRASCREHPNSPPPPPHFQDSLLPSKLPQEPPSLRGLPWVRYNTRVHVGRRVPVRAQLLKGERAGKRVHRRRLDVTIRCLLVSSGICPSLHPRCWSLR